MNRDRMGKALVAEMPRLRGVALRIAKSDAAEDLLQDGIVRALAHADQFDEGTNLVAWVGFIMRNRWFSQGRRAFRSVQMADGQAEAVPAPPNAHHVAELREAIGALDYLPREQREALIAIGLDEGSYEDAAEALGCEVGTMKSRVHRGREALRIFFSGG